MLKGLKVTEKFPYISERDDYKVPDGGILNVDEAKAAGATIFWLGTLTAAQRAEISDGVMGYESATGLNPESAKAMLKFNNARQTLAACKAGLRGWDNFVDDEGNEIKFTTVEVTVGGKKVVQVADSCLDRLPSWLITEIGRRLINANSLTGAERGNLLAQL